MKWIEISHTKGYGIKISEDLKQIQSFIDDEYEVSFRTEQLYPCFIALQAGLSIPTNPVEITDLTGLMYKEPTLISPKVLHSPDYTLTFPYNTKNHFGILKQEIAQLLTYLQEHNY